MEENMRMFRRFVILSVLFFAAAIVLALDLLPAKESQTDETEIPVSILSADSIRYISWGDETAEQFTLRQETDAQWSCEGYDMQALAQDRIKNTVTALCQVISTREIEPADNDESYGLSPCQSQVTIVTDDGKEIIYRLGSLNTYTNRYYFRLNDETVVHMVGYSVGAAMQCELSDFVK